MIKTGTKEPVLKSLELRGTNQHPLPHNSTQRIKVVTPIKTTKYKQLFTPSIVNLQKNRHSKFEVKQPYFKQREQAMLKYGKLPKQVVKDHKILKEKSIGRLDMILDIYDKCGWDKRILNLLVELEDLWQNAIVVKQEIITPYPECIDVRDLIEYAYILIVRHHWFLQKPNVIAKIVNDILAVFMDNQDKKGKCFGTVYKPPSNLKLKPPFGRWVKGFEGRYVVDKYKVYCVGKYRPYRSKKNYSSYNVTYFLMTYSQYYGNKIYTRKWQDEITFLKKPKEIKASGGSKNWYYLFDRGGVFRIHSNDL